MKYHTPQLQSARRVVCSLINIHCWQRSLWRFCNFDWLVWLFYYFDWPVFGLLRFLFIPSSFRTFLPAAAGFWGLFFFFVVFHVSSGFLEFSEFLELPEFPGPPSFSSTAYLFLLKLICFAFVSIAVNGDRYKPYI